MNRRGHQWLLKATRLVACGLLVLGCANSCKKGKDLKDGSSGRALLDAVKIGNNEKAAILLGEGVYTEVRDENGNTPLLYSVKTGNTQLVRMMLKLDVNRDARSGNGKGPLELALDSGNKEMVLCLLNGGVSPDEVGRNNNPLLLKAVRFREMATVNLLLKSGVTPSATGKDGSTALHVAAEHGLMECMDILLSAGADPDVRTDEGASPAWVAMNSRDPVARFLSLNRLLEAGADVNILGPKKKHLLTETVRRGLFKEAVELINYGADIGGSGEDGISPLRLAASMGNDEMVVMLLSRGANGSELLNAAVESADVELLRLLADSGVGVNEWTGSGKDSLIASCVRKGLLELAEVCLQQGADPSEMGSEGQTPLHMAIALRDDEMVRTLLKNEADPNKVFSRPASKAFLKLTEKESMRWFLKNERRITPLMMAANNGDIAVIKALLDYGAKKYVCSGRHRLYPLNFASRRGDVKAMQVILGQDPDKEIHHGILDLSEQRMRIYNAKQEVIFNSRVSTGKSGFRTPQGTFVITDKHKSHNSTIYGSSMPYFQRLSCSAFGFHSGHCPSYPASHGCIRMPYSAAKKLFGLTPVGTRIVIQP